MANNRLYLVCNQCGKTLMLAKDFMSGFGLRVTADDIAKFLDEHTYCGDEGSPGDFSIGYELPDYCTGPCVEVKDPYSADQTWAEYTFKQTSEAEE